MLREPDPRGLSGNSAVIGNVLRRHGPCAHLYPPPDPDAAHESSPGTDQAVWPNAGCPAVHLSNGDVLINPAVLPDLSVLGNKDAMQTVGKGGTSINDRAQPHIPAMAVGASEEQKAEHSAPEPRSGPLPQAVHLPKEGQIVPFGPVD